MTGEKLRVTTGHLSDLALRQAQAASDTRAATLSEGSAELRSTHGAIASDISGALDAVLASRRSAGAKVAGVADALCDKVSAAAREYDRTDDAMGSTLDAQMHSGQP